MVKSAMAAKRKDESLVRPDPWNMRRDRVLYIPADVPGRCLRHYLKATADRVSLTPFGELYLFKESIVLFQAMGAPLAVLALENLIAGGAREILMLGFSGSLAPRFSTGDAIVVCRARSEEGTSAHYFPVRKVFHPSPEMKRSVERRLTSLGLPFREAALVSTDAPYRETRSWLRKQTAKGIGLVDMETSAVFALAEFRGLESAALMIVSDELRPDSWKDGFFQGRLRERAEEYFFPFIK